MFENHWDFIFFTEPLRFCSFNHMYNFVILLTHSHFLAVLLGWWWTWSSVCRMMMDGLILSKYYYYLFSLQFISKFLLLYIVMDDSWLLCKLSLKFCGVCLPVQWYVCVVFAGSVIYILYVSGHIAVYGDTLLCVWSYFILPTCRILYASGDMLLYGSVAG
jgi:hypothetical protein